MSKTINAIGFAAAALFATSAFAATTTSPQQNKPQVHSMWCWNASVRNLIYTESKGALDLWQCDIANFAFEVDYACKYNNVFKWNDRANSGNYLRNPGTKDAFSILQHYGFRNLRFYPGALSFAHTQQSIDNNHGVLTSWRWTSGNGGHVVVAYGYDVHADGSQWVKISDPWPGEGEYWRSYGEYVSNSEHTTRGTLRVLD